MLNLPGKRLTCRYARLTRRQARSTFRLTHAKTDERVYVRKNEGEKAHAADMAFDKISSSVRKSGCCLSKPRAK